ncbi:PEP-CTERM sorting domain-containing protein [Akkermansiaceae bacterium]|nr:PEP-CTERM sorting domain-containing protein [Akkermansiaceae bacterium]
MKISFLISGICVGAVSAATVNINTLADLGEPSETVKAIGQTATYQNRTVGGVEAVTTKDATFAVSIDFNAGDSANNGVIWESGGATIGSTLSYNQAAATLSVHHSTNNGNALGVVTHQLTDAQVSGGEVEVVWAYDASEIDFELFVDGASSGTTVDTTEVARTQNNWSGGNAAGFGIFGGNFAAGNGDNTNLAAIANLGDTATLNLDTGLRFWAGTDAQFAVAVPEPSSIALLGLASLFAMRRQRR